MSGKENKPGLDESYLDSIRVGIMAIEEQLEVLSEGMSNQYNVDGYLDQQGIDDAIETRRKALVCLALTTPMVLEYLKEGESK